MNREAIDITTVVLMNDDKTLQLSIGFFGYKQEDIEAYLTKNYIECSKDYALKYEQMKYI